MAGATELAKHAARQPGRDEAAAVVGHQHGIRAGQHVEGRALETRPQLSVKALPDTAINAYHLLFRGVHPTREDARLDDGADRRRTDDASTTDARVQCRQHPPSRIVPTDASIVGIVDSVYT